MLLLLMGRDLAMAERRRTTAIKRVLAHALVAGTTAVGLAPQILVNCIAPGYLEGTRATANLDPDFQEQARQGALRKRAADKDDIADQVVALCRTDSITGQTLVIDSGRFFH